MKEVFRHDLKEDWIDFELFSEKLNAKIENKRLSEGGGQRPKEVAPLSSIASFKVQQSKPLTTCYLCRAGRDTFFFTSDTDAPTLQSPTSDIDSRHRFQKSTSDTFDSNTVQHFLATPKNKCHI